MYEYVLYESLSDGKVVRITLNRPEAHNAQNRQMLVDLDNAFRAAEADDDVRVIILAGAGPSFSAGHDLGSPVVVEEFDPGPRQHPTVRVDGGTRRGVVEQRTLQEWHYYFQNTRRWRDLRKITIAQVHGNVMSAGLMLMWACDLIVAADDTTFADVVGTRLGMCGVEYMGHPWEFGPRKAKELLLTGDSIDADEGYRLGMVSKIFPKDQIDEMTVEFANRIASRPTMAALMVKDSVNDAVDQMGFSNSLKHSFALHQLNHAHWSALNDDKFPAAKPGKDIEDWRTSGRPKPARKDIP
ncbi:enoyl-CoA hydratase [Rhodococcus rhodochrous]|uniref:Enoyl-CoA hydratase n=1 Tax=Rhodococcus rhodochrous KG-21 TaxID=1441923 RepID=A0A0M9WN62_RHORH|nr:enoyl-CoA hydratase [Rhodococcus rhodochrous]KOS55247.1 enoyl-CoA hydratase [Rhodococcus rhodochrous KG-21]